MTTIHKGLGNMTEMYNFLKTLKIEDDIEVALSTTKYTVTIDENSVSDIVKLNAPICSAQMHSSLKGGLTRFKRICKRMAQTVIIERQDMSII